MENPPHNAYMKKAVNCFCTLLNASILFIPPGWSTPEPKTGNNTLKSTYHATGKSGTTANGGSQIAKTDNYRAKAANSSKQSPPHTVPRAAAQSIINPGEFLEFAALESRQNSSATAAQSNLREAIKAYESGKTEQAVLLLMKNIKEHPEDGEAHYYLGLALKKIGHDANAINELELAIRLCPTDVGQNLAKQALRGTFNDPPPGKPASTSAATSPFSSLFEPLQAAIRSGKRWWREQNRASNRSSENASQSKPSNQSGQSGPFGVSIGRGGGDVIPMEQMLEIAEQSKLRSPQWQSDKGGVERFAQAPETTIDWDNWIRRFRKAFNSQLFRRLANRVTNEKHGAAAVIFSLDKYGQLRGCIYASDASQVVNEALLDTIREFNRSFVVQFPASSHIDGWNFRMQWVFDRALMQISALKERKAKALAALQRLRETEIAILKKAEANAKTASLRAKAEAIVQAKQKQLDAQKQAMAKVTTQVKTGVTAQIIAKPKPLELKAVQLKLSDMPAIAADAANGNDTLGEGFNMSDIDLSGYFK